MCDQLSIPLDEFDERIDWQRQKISARIQKRKLIEENYKEPSVQHNKLKTGDKNRSLLKSYTYKRGKNASGFEADDGNKENKSFEQLSFRKKTIISQTDFDRKIELQKKKIATRNQMLNSVKEDYHKAGFQTNSLEPQKENVRINVISKNNPCTAKSCMPKQGSWRNAKQCHFGTDPEVVVCEIPKGDERYLFSSDDDAALPVTPSERNNSPDGSGAPPYIRKHG